MERRYQVFISSTFVDLVEEKRNVIQALLELDCIPAGMELFPASDEEQWNLIKTVIDDCDYYVVIVGGRYGSTTADGISYTEKEFDYAVSVNKPILVFLHEDPSRIEAGKSEMEPDAQRKLAEFRRKAEEGRTCKYWMSAEDLGAKVSRSLVKTTKARPAEGWVKGRYANTPEHYSQLNSLREENERLKTEISALSAAAPTGTAQYAGGTDQFVVEGQLEVGDEKRVEAWQHELTWDAIFGYLGPCLYEERSEDRMRSHLANAMKTLCREYPQDEVRSIEVDGECFQAIKIQLLALGLIMTGDRLGDSENLHWILSPYGKTYLLSLRAIRKGEVERHVEALRNQAIKRL